MSAFIIGSRSGLESSKELISKDSLNVSYSVVVSWTFTEHAWTVDSTITLKSLLRSMQKSV